SIVRAHQEIADTRDQQCGRLVRQADLEILALVVEREGLAPATAGDAATDAKFIEAAVDRVALLVENRRRKLEAVAARIGQRNAVATAQRLVDLRDANFRIHTVAATVDAAVLPTKQGARPGVGAEADAGTVFVPLARLQPDLHRYAPVLRLVA